MPAQSAVALVRIAVEPNVFNEKMLECLQKCAVPVPGR